MVSFYRTGGSKEMHSEHGSGFQLLSVMLRRWRDVLTTCGRLSLRSFQISRRLQLQVIYLTQ